MISAGITILFYVGIALGVANTAGDPNRVAQAVAGDSVTIRQQVERQRMSAMEPNQPTQTHALKEVVQQLAALQVTDNSAAAAAEKIKGEKKESAPSLSPAAAPMSPATEHNKESVSAPAPGLDTIENPVNAMATADALYQAKDYQNAVRFYRMAAQNAGKADPAGRQWALYQTANCLRSTDAKKAIEAYQQMIAEYPSSSWAPAALIQQRNLEWLQQNQPVLSKTKTLNDPNQQ